MEARMASSSVGVYGRATASRRAQFVHEVRRMVVPRVDEDLDGGRRFHESTEGVGWLRRQRTVMRSRPGRGRSAERRGAEVVGGELVRGGEAAGDCADLPVGDRPAQTVHGAERGRVGAFIVASRSVERYPAWIGEADAGPPSAGRGGGASRLCQRGLDSFEVVEERGGRLVAQQPEPVQVGLVQAGSEVVLLPPTRRLTRPHASTGGAW
ncbi:hypothetical protein GCM10022227_19110 [Streptomyces sedi]